MNPFRWARLRLRALAGRRRLERDMQDEMREHLERAADRYAARGLTPDEARAAARREFGNVPQLQEEARDARGARWVETLSGDVRFALRYFRHHKATTAILVAVLALGTGANTVIFSAFQAAFRRPPPAVPDDGAHTRIWAEERSTRAAPWQRRGFTGPELAALVEQRGIFQAVAGWTVDAVALDRGDQTRAVPAQFVTPNYFETLGVPLAAGRGFRQDPGGEPDLSAVMAFKDAERLFGTPAAAVGQRILVNEVPVRVGGVAPPRFQGALRNMNGPVLWMPLGAREAISRLPRRWLADEPALSVFARLAPGASPAQATALAQYVVAATLPDSAARVGMARTAQVFGLHALPPNERSQMYLAFTLMLGVGGLILLVACTNVSSLMVAAAVGRRHEIAVRLSLGASRGRLLRQLVTESTLLALAGSLLGLLLAWWTLTWQAKTETDVSLPPDLTTFAFVLVMAVATGVLFGLSPALHAIRGGLSNALRDAGTGSRSRSRLQRGFVVAQIACSQPLLVMLGVMLSMVIADYRPHAPEMSRHVIAVRFHPLPNGAPAQRAEAIDALLPRIAERPEVLAAVPDADAFAIRRIAANHPRGGVKADSVPTIVHVEGTAPGWFELVDVPIVLGRDVALADTAASEHAIVIGSDLARALWAGASPIGRTLASPGIADFGQDSISMTVVGVYDATRRLPGMSWGGGAATTDATTRVYTAHGKHWQRDRILVRTRGPAADFLPELQRFVRAAAPSLPVTSMMTLAHVDEQEYLITLRLSALAGAGGLLALLLASLGLYGIVSLAVRQRMREIGIRIAVGAHPMRVARMFLASGVRVSLVALALGLPLSIIVLKLSLAKSVFIAPQVNPYLIGLVIALVLLAVASAATWLPARRAAQVDPARTLRVE